MLVYSAFKIRVALKYNYTIHEASIKHNQKKDENKKIYICECKKPYTSYMGYWRHKKCCLINNSISISTNKDNNLLLEKMDEIQKNMKNIIIELNKNQTQI